MRIHKIIYLLWPMIIFSLPVESISDRRRTLEEEYKHKRQISAQEEKPRTQKTDETSTEKASSDDDEDKKTLAQQVVDGKYGLIQTELFSSPVKRPGIISYEVNPEVPKDNINNLGGLKPEEIWLAENHLLVLRGGNFNDKEETGKISWPPIDNYVAPQRQVKIPPNPKIPPPFPVQLKEGGPIELVKGKNNSKNVPPYLSGGPFGPPFLFPLPQTYPSGPESSDKSNQGNFSVGSGSPPFPFLPPELGLYPPAIAFLPPPGNFTELDEDDPRIYYPPKYDFVYKKNYTSFVPPGPLVPGIVLPPPPNFFAALENNTRPSRPNGANKPTSSLKKPKSRPTFQQSSRQKYINPSHSFTSKGHSSRGHKIMNPIHVTNLNGNSILSPKLNTSNEEWVPIPAPRPFYITDINKLRALTSTKRIKEPIKYDGPTNGWDYENETEMGMKKEKEGKELSKISGFKNYGRENSPTTDVYEQNEKFNVIPYTTERPEQNIKVTLLPHYYTTESMTESYKTSTLHPTTERNTKVRVSTTPAIYSNDRYKNNFKQNVLVEDFKAVPLPPSDLPNFAISSPSTFVDEENKPRPKPKQPDRSRGKYANTSPPVSFQRPIEQYLYNRPFLEINTVLPQKVFTEVTIKTPTDNRGVPFSGLEYEEDYGNTVKPIKPSPLYYYSQDTKQTNEDDGYSYDVPSNPYIPNQYHSITGNQDQKIRTYTTTTKKPPFYEYSYSAPGYGTLESPKVGNPIETTPSPIIFESSFKTKKQSPFSLLDYQTYRDHNYKHSSTTPTPSTTARAQGSNRNKYANKESYQTENPYSSYNTHDLSLLDEITKKYFTLFGQRINPESGREVTTSLPKLEETYKEKPVYKNYGSITAVTTQAPSPNVRFPDPYDTESERPYYDYPSQYSTQKAPVPNRNSKPKTKQIDYSYYYSQRDPIPGEYKDYEEEVRPYHPLESDVNVNYKYPRPNINPDAELINPGYLNPVQVNGNSYVSYRLPGNAGHFYFLTPQAAPPQSYPIRPSRVRYQQELEKQGYLTRNFRHK